MAKKKEQDILVVPVDFTSFSEEALVFASRLAKCMSAQLLVLHVIHDPAESPGFYARKLKKYCNRADGEIIGYDGFQ